RTPDPEISNYLPNNTRAVVDLSVKELLTSSVRPPALETPGAFREKDFKEVFGLGLDDLTRVVIGLNNQANTVCSVVRLNKGMKKKTREEFLERLGAVEKGPINAETYHVTGKPFDALGNLLFKGNQPRDAIAVKFLDPQTLIFADEKTMEELLHCE